MYNKKKESEIDEGLKQLAENLYEYPHNNNEIRYKSGRSLELFLKVKECDKLFLSIEESFDENKKHIKFNVDETTYLISLMHIESVKVRKNG